MQGLCSFNSILSLFKWSVGSSVEPDSATTVALQAQEKAPESLMNSVASDPESFFSDNCVWISHSKDYLSQIQSDTVQQQYAVYPQCGYSPGLYLAHNQGGAQSTEEVRAIYTPTRSDDSPDRHALPDKFAPENNSLWLTDKQSGCVVAIIKWPLSISHQHEYSMVHLQPNSWKGNPENKALLWEMWDKHDGEGISAFQDAHLKQELLTMFTNISDSGDLQPEGYILSFSSCDDQCHELTTQIVGVARDREFVFYEQKTARATTVPASCKELSFTAWENFRAELMG